jgi:hypothetical protein
MQARYFVSNSCNKSQFFSEIIGLSESYDYPLIRRSSQ